MDLPVVQAKETLKNGNFTWIDNVYQGSIPEEEQGNADTTDALIQEYINEPADYANGFFKSWEIGIELQIFYKAKTDFNLQDVEIDVSKQFLSEKWLIDQSKSRVKDPDTKRWTKVFYFSKKIRNV